MSNESGRTYAGLNLQQRKKLRREQFLAAALNVFGTTGFRSATVRSICKEAKLTDRYFYESFGSLEKLLMGIYEQCMKNMRKEILQAIITEYNENGTVQAVLTGIDTYFKVLTDPKVARICMQELEGISLEVNTLYYHYIDSFAHMLIHLANHAYPDWQLEKKQKTIIGISLVGAMRQSATSWLIGHYNMDRKTLVTANAQLFLGLINTMEQPKLMVNNYS